MTKPTRVIPAKAGIQPWGHDEVQAASRRKRSQAGKSWRAVIFWCSRSRLLRWESRNPTEDYVDLSPASPIAPHVCSEKPPRPMFRVPSGS